MATLVIVIGHLMLRLIYTSHAPQLLGPAALEQILSSSRQNNARDTITGVLVYHDGSFLQLLEGPQAAVLACYERIQKDPRHTRCIRMLSETCATRIFSDWHMAYQSYTAMAPSQQRQFMDLQAFAKRISADDIAGDPRVTAIVMAFLSAFRELDVAV
jgi:hypothetical protein